MSWETQTAKSEFDAKSYTNNQIDSRSGQRAESTGGYNGGGLFGIGAQSYSIVGMDANQIPAVRQDLGSYVQAIEEHIQQIDASTDANNAFRGEEVQSAVTAYVEKVKEYCINLCSQLRAFSDKLADAQAAWETGTGNIAGTVNDGNSSFATGTKYTEQK